MGVSGSVANKYAMFIGKKYKYTGKIIITENNYICQYDNHTNIKLTISPNYENIVDISPSLNPIGKFVTFIYDD